MYNLAKEIDRIDRNALFYKLSCMGVSTKFLNLLRSLYSDTKSAVWNGEIMSEYFDTKTGLSRGAF